MNLCECGCGKPTAIAKYSSKRDGYIKGQPARFLPGHNQKKNNHRWNGGKTSRRGYKMTLNPTHPRADNKDYVPDAYLIVEKIIGKFLPLNVVIHHINGNQSDDVPSNLLVCQDASYHQMIHKRQEAYRACGQASWRKCWICKKYDEPSNLHFTGKRSQTAHHIECRKFYDSMRTKVTISKD